MEKLVFKNLGFQNVTVMATHYISGANKERLCTYSGFCKLCQKEVSCENSGFAQLLQHATGLGHTKKMKDHLSPAQGRLSGFPASCNSSGSNTEIHLGLHSHA